MNWAGLFIVAGYIGVIVIAWPWGLLAAALHALILLATVRR